MKKVLLWTLSILVLLALAVVVRNYLPSQPVVEAPAQQEEIQPLDELPVDELSEVITGEGVNTELPDITEFVRTETVNCELGCSIGHEDGGDTIEFSKFISPTLGISIEYTSKETYLYGGTHIPDIITYEPPVRVGNLVCPPKKENIEDKIGCIEFMSSEERTDIGTREKGEEYTALIDGTLKKFVNYYTGWKDEFGGFYQWAIQRFHIPNTNIYYAIYDVGVDHSNDGSSYFRTIEAL